MFRSESLNKLFQEIKNQSNSNNKCLISKLDLYDNNTVTLECGHSYRINYFSKLINKKILTCPYCNFKFTRESIEKKCTICDKKTISNLSLCNKHLKEKK